MKKLIIRKGTNEILCIADEVRLKSNGYQAGNFIFPLVDDLFMIDVPSVPEGVKEYEWCFEAERGFYGNPNFMPIKPPEEQLKDARAQITSLERIIKQMNDDQLAFMEDILSVLQ